mmetsp:Transcript_13538/g.36189  ORF Transcript_13538/g.36189 Transcript_13538/m.36189 type:complete len:289 (-) Transcript_13538:768-1634(-)
MRRLILWMSLRSPAPLAPNCPRATMLCGASSANLQTWRAAWMTCGQRWGASGPGNPSTPTPTGLHPPSAEPSSSPKWRQRWRPQQHLLQTRKRAQPTRTSVWHWKDLSQMKLPRAVSWPRTPGAPPWWSSRWSASAPSSTPATAISSRSGMSTSPRMAPVRGGIPRKRRRVLARMRTSELFLPGRTLRRWLQQWRQLERSGKETRAVVLELHARPFRVRAMPKMPCAHLPHIEPRRHLKSRRNGSSPMTTRPQGTLAATRVLPRGTYATFQNSLAAPHHVTSRGLRSK